MRFSFCAPKAAHREVLIPLSNVLPKKVICHPEAVTRFVLYARECCFIGTHTHSPTARSWQYWLERRANLNCNIATSSVPIHVSAWSFWISLRMRSVKESRLCRVVVTDKKWQGQKNAQSQPNNIKFVKSSLLKIGEQFGCAHFIGPEIKRFFLVCILSLKAHQILNSFSLMITTPWKVSNCCW